MCGIAGIWNLSGQKASVDVLQKMLSVQQHRGPEDAAYTSMNDGRLLLGFLKLGFTDTQLGMQPLFNEDGSIGIVYNGEIYDYEILRAELIQKGHRFYTQSDSEVLIHLYEEYGPDFIHHLNGEFAFVIYDDRKQQCFVGRDPFGINPLTYAFHEGRFYFSSEAKGILVTENFERALNPNYLKTVGIGIPNTEETLFKGIKNLRPGHCMVITENGIEKHYQYWNPSFEKTSDNFETAQKRVRKELKAAVERRLVGNPPIALSLSSGIDSTIIAGLTKELGHDVPVFSLGYSGKSYDESAIAKQTAAHFDLKFNRVELSLEQIVDNFKQSLFHTENMTNSLSNSARFLMDSAIRKSGLKAITGGEASDEVFGGYPYFVLEALWRKRLNKEAEAEDLFKQFKAQEKLSHRIFWDEPKGWNKGNGPYSSPILVHLRAERSGMLARLWSSSVQGQFDAKTTAEMFLEEIPPAYCANLSGFDTTRVVARSVISAFGFPGLGDRIEMGNSLEGRVPFLDVNVLKYAYSLPESYCIDINNVQGKYILREAFADLLPPSFQGPPKHTFMSPTFSEGFGTNAGKALYRDYLSSQKIKKIGILNPTIVTLIKGLWKMMPSSFRSYLFVDSIMGLLLSVQVLQDIFIEQDPLKYSGRPLITIRRIDAKV